jgi:hypothetical protein
VTPAPARRGERAAPVEAKKPEVVEADPPTLKRTDIVSLEEAEESGAEVTIEDEEEIVDLGDDEAEIPAGDDDSTFLEEEEEGETDVKGIVGGAQPEES